MTDSSTSNGSPIETAAKDLIDDWKEHCKLPNKISSYKDLIERLEERNPPGEDEPTRKEMEQALIHSEDWAYWSDSQRKTASMYVNGHREEFNEESPLFPNVPQPFMGVLDTCRLSDVARMPGAFQHLFPVQSRS